MLSVLLTALSMPAHASCYQLPFSNPNLADGWGSTCCGRTNPHRGVDFPQATGTAIPAVSNGRVVVNQWSSCLGNVVVVEHPDGWFSGYAHLNVASPLAVGSLVQIGDSVGQVGNTGSCSNGAHLHLTLADHIDGWYTGTTVDPYAFIVANGPTPEVCDGDDDDCDGLVDNSATCEVDYLHAQAGVYAPPSTTDVNGDGHTDVCALEEDGFRCWPGSVDAWAAPLDPIRWPHSDGWDAPSRYATIRMGDLNADGLADVCALEPPDVLCALSEGTAFAAPTPWLTGLTLDQGWDQPHAYSTLRLVDVNGDGGDDLCLLDSTGLQCHLSNGTQFDSIIAGPAWPEARDAPTYYGTLRMGDIDGDGRADACIRRPDGVDCHISDGSGFGSTAIEIDWSDSRGFAPFQYWATFHLADVDGDGRKEPCIRSSAGYRCGLSDGSRFQSPSSIVAPLANDRGWTDPTNYLTIRLADIDGDGAEEVCARGDAGLYCWSFDGSQSSQITGPGWTDEQGWPAPSFLNTIRLADATGDGLADACGRGSQGWRCVPSTAVAFEGQFAGGFLTNDDGADRPAVFGSVWSGGRSCGVNNAPDCTHVFLTDTSDTSRPPRDTGADPDVPTDDPPSDDGAAPRAACGCACTRPIPPLGFAIVVVALVRRRRTGIQHHPNLRDTARRTL